MSLQSIKITSLNDIGNNIGFTSLIPVVDMAGNPTTKKANLQILGNLILSSAGGSFFAPATQAINAQTVSNAAQPAITSLGTLTSLTVSGVTNLGPITNLVITGGQAGQVLSSNGDGTVYWQTGSSGAAGATGATGPIGATGPSGTFDEPILPYLELTNNPFGELVFFEKQDNGDEVDIISDGLHITRGEYGWLYNPLEEDEYGQSTPTNSLWNNDGWSDLTNIETREYTTLLDIWDQNFSDIVGSNMIMKDTTTDKYYAVEFLSWSRSGQGGQGGFSYNRYEIDLTKIQQGITFADGTKLNSTTDILTSVRSTAPGRRRIEEATGYIEVSVDELVVIETLPGTAINNPSPQPWDIYLDRVAHPEIDDAVTLNGRYGDNVGPYSWQVTINGITYSDGVEVYKSTTYGDYIIIYVGDNITINYSAGTEFILELVDAPRPRRWFTVPGSSFRGAIIDFHAYSTNAGTIIGTIHIARDDGDYNITHTETSSGSSNLSNVDMWFRDRNQNEREIYFRRLDNQSDTLKVHWVAKLFFGDETYD
jgi:hypothetical protein